MNPLVRASVITLGLIFSFILFILILAGLYTESLSLTSAISLTVVINFLCWILGPLISDFIYRVIYKVHFYSSEEFSRVNPDLYAFIDSVCKTYKFKFPKIGIISDRNPTAFTYGSTRNNARIIVTEGITHYLSPDEVKAVIAHELGHIHHADFIIMSIAVTLIQVLYELYFVLSKTKNSSRGKKGPLALVGLISYIFYIISSYLLLYLSRVREYYADSFSAQVTKSPHSLTQALVKIAYGIVQAADTDSSKRLLESTRSMGILDVKNAGFISGLVYGSADPLVVAQVMSFDNLSPWAKILELSSTHPLTGKRILALENIAQNLGQQKMVDFEKALSGMQVDKAKLYKNFYFEIFIYFLPFLLPVPGFIFGGIGGAIIGFALGSILKINYQMREEPGIPSTVIAEMKNIYASPMRGKPVSFDGKIVGRGVPGYIFSEDLMFQDATGLMYLNYNNFLGWLGNILFALKAVKNLLGQNAKVEGWFFRGITQSLTLRKINSSQKTITSHPKIWFMVRNIFLLLLGTFLISLGFALP